jgi:hypothetical protein
MVGLINGVRRVWDASARVVSEPRSGVRSIYVSISDIEAGMRRAVLTALESPGQIVRTHSLQGIGPTKEGIGR